MARRWQDGPGTLGLPEGGAVALEIAASYRARTRGLLGRDGIGGDGAARALLLTPAGSVHTFGMRFAIDVAYLDRRLRVLAVRTMVPGRLGLPRVRSRHVLEAAAGAMAGWGLRPGVTVSVAAGGAEGWAASGAGGGAADPG
ncbi:DUF192 domain-containing protein [Streptomyces sp. NBC_00536]|uniref:DUF192 domain-containing protein n=1 Tax=Streptomyces sp. NBC_00536 TaxID=2975769 RepID=UPI002E7FDBAD|nr:DUF192 domain-containing protein [Streptomyces sp. NBC_00536]WUC81019.1 DUF192 domain-containing protein [Streptomyces sp. NBC_00536]